MSPKHNIVILFLGTEGLGVKLTLSRPPKGAGTGYKFLFPGKLFKPAPAPKKNYFSISITGTGIRL